MKLIIDISEETYNALIGDEWIDGEYIDNMINSIQNGTPPEEELEKIKEKIYRHHNITCNLKCATCFLEYNCELRRKIDLLEDLAIIDKHIEELKGE